MDINKFLDKDINDINIEDLIVYFSVEQEETSTIEFKSGEVTLEKIYPEICAFLNTNGGILVIGAPVKSNIRSKEVYKGDLVPSKNIKSSFILSQKISSNIVPAGLNIKIKELEYKDGKIYILNIPQSKYPPHQNSQDGVYYIRLESETTKAPHGLIQAMFNKRQYPNLEIALYLHNENNKRIVFELRNESLITALKGGYMIEILGVNSFYLIKETKTKQSVNNVNLIIGENEVCKNDDKYHFSYRNIFETLNKGLFYQREFIVDTFESNFIISIVTWAKDTELKHKLWIINPNDGKAIFQTNEIIDDYKELFHKYNIKSSILIKDKHDEQ